MDIIGAVRNPMCLSGVDYVRSMTHNWCRLTTGTGGPCRRCGALWGRRLTRPRPSIQALRGKAHNGTWHLMAYRGDMTLHFQTRRRNVHWLSIKMQTHNWPYMHNMHVSDDLEDGEHLRSEGKEGWGLKLVAYGFAMRTQSESKRVVGSYVLPQYHKSVQVTGKYMSPKEGQVENRKLRRSIPARSVWTHVSHWHLPFHWGCTTGPTLQREPIETHNVAPFPAGPQ